MFLFASSSGVILFGPVFCGCCLLLPSRYHLRIAGRRKCFIIGASGMLGPAGVVRHLFVPDYFPTGYFQVTVDSV